MSLGLTGGCSCGEVRYELLSEPMFVHCCYWYDCQRQSGNAFALDAIIEADRVRLISGHPEPNPVPTDSGRGHDIYRCPKCHVEVWSIYGKTTWQRFVKVGTLDDPLRIRPSVHIYTRSKAPWIALPSGAPTFEAGYDRRSVWPPDADARRKAAKEAWERAEAN
jgi:hypothetical protein